MKIIIFCAGEWGNALRLYLEKKAEDTIVGFVDNNVNASSINGYCLYKPSDIHKIEFDKIIIAVSKKSVMNNIRQQLIELKIPKEKIIGILDNKELLINTLANRDNIYDEMTDRRVGWLHSFANHVRSEKILGNVAECGVYTGDFAFYINKYFSEKKLYLFDTFEGFSEVDLETERQLNENAFITSDFNKEQNFSFNSDEIARRKMPYLDKCEFHKGYFPESAKGIEDVFCFVNLDMDLYQPMLAGLEYFYEKMSHGGVILLHDYFHPDLPGVRKAVQDYEDKHNVRLNKLPIGDGGSLAIIKA